MYDNLLQVMHNAQTAFESIKALSISQRIKYIKNLKQIIIKNQNFIIDQIVKDTKKTSFEAYFCEIFPVISFLSFIEKTAHNALKPQKVKTPFFLFGKTSKIYFDPIGTVLVISAWNYPFYLGIIPSLTAFVCGNAVIIKPSELAPLIGVWEQLFKESGFDQNWIQLVYGNAQVTTELISSKPNKIFFVGSTKTGKKILEQTAKNIIPVDLELGGKDAMIVCDGANLKKASAAAIWGAFCNAGQLCSSIEKIYVHNKIYEAFKAQLIHKLNMLIQHIKSDAYHQKQIGKIISQSHFNRIRQYISEALYQGAKLINHSIFAYSINDLFDESDLLIYPTILENVSNDSLLSSEETFGPVAILDVFEDIEALINKINQNNYGLGISIWSSNTKEIQNFINNCRVGNICINNVIINLANPYLPFGGVRNSGFGRYKGMLGYLSFVNPKSVMCDHLSFMNEIFWYPYTDLKYKIIRFFSKFL